MLVATLAKIPMDENQFDQFRQAVEMAPTAMVMIDEGGTINMVNLQTEKIFGYARDELLGKSVDILLPERFRGNHSQHRRHFFAAPDARAMGKSRDLFGMRRDGSEFQVEIGLNPITTSDGTRALAAIVDISERKRVDQLLKDSEESLRNLNITLEQRVTERTSELAAAITSLKQSQEELARSATKAILSTLVASVSHEIKTPIGNSVLAATTANELIQSTLALVNEGGLRRSALINVLEDLKSCMSIVERNLNRANDLLNSFRHVAADQASEQRRHFDLAETVREIIETLKPSLKRYAHRIEMTIPDGIVMDSQPGPLGQIVINLINNAYMHAFENRQAGRLTIDAVKSGDNVIMHFIDNGIGITEEHLEKLFQDFFSTKIGSGGTGLGLSIVKNLVTKTLSGHIAVRSTVGQGTEFTIQLPINLPTAKDEA